MVVGVIIVAVPSALVDNKFKVPLLLIVVLTVSCLPAFTVNEDPVPIDRFGIFRLSANVMPAVLFAVSVLIMSVAGNSFPFVADPLYVRFTELPKVGTAAKVPTERTTVAPLPNVRLVELLNVPFVNDNCPLTVNTEPKLTVPDV